MPQRRRSAHSAHKSDTNRMNDGSIPDDHSAAACSPTESPAGVRRQSGQTSARERLG